jgi:hypothetical protein
MSRRMSTLGQSVSSIALLIGLAGCGAESPYAVDAVARNVSEAGAPAPHGPGAAGWAGFFPLEIGNRWEYSHLKEAKSFNLDDSLVETWNITGSESHEMIGTEDLLGRTYVVQQQDWEESSFLGDDSGTIWVRYRQERSGLYEADLCVSDPPGPEESPFCGDPLLQAPSRISPKSVPPHLRDTWRKIQEKRAVLAGLVRGHGAPQGTRTTGAPGGVLPGELTRLAYPLHRGTEWTIREDPLFLAEVISHDVIDVPAGRFPAWRVQISLPQFEAEGDEIYFWYGSSGFLKLYFHSVSEWTDPGGAVIGAFEWTETMDLTELHLEGGESAAQSLASNGSAGVE